MRYSSTLPNGRVLLAGMMLTRERLRTGIKAAISVPVLRAILTAAIAQLPFDEDFYLATYPDIKDAYHAGRITDLHEHFVEDGYLEGRLGTMPEFDVEFYTSTYPDVADALASGDLTSAFEHYVRAGCYEGRCANLAEMENIQPWMDLLRSA